MGCRETPFLVEVKQKALQENMVKQTANIILTLFAKLIDYIKNVLYYKSSEMLLKICKLCTMKAQFFFDFVVHIKV